MSDEEVDTDKPLNERQSVQKHDKKSKQRKRCAVAKERVFVLGLVLLLTGIILVIVLVGFWSKEDTKELRGRFGIIFDVGGSGTRMSIYEYKHGKKMVEIDYIKCEKIGLAKYVNDQSNLIRPIKKCLYEAEKAIPFTVLHKTPLYMGATGGMRILRLKNKSGYDNIWRTVGRILRNSSFPVKLADTLPGNKEAAYSWTTLNALLNKQVTSGLFELGSTSFQLAFVPLESAQIPDKHQETVLVNKKNYTVHVHSYLCFGKDEFIRRYKAKLVQSSNYGSITSDPCMFEGHEANVTAIYLSQSPCVQGSYAKNTLGKSIDDIPMNRTFTLRGSSNFSECYDRVRGMFNDTVCTKGTCSVNNIYQPDAKGLFTAIGGGAYYSSKFLNLPEKVSINNYRNATQRLCEMSYKQVQQEKGFSKYTSQYCLADVYIYYLLNNVLKLDKGVVKFEKKINGKRLSWTLGSILNKIKEMSPPILKISKSISNTVFCAFIIVAVFIIILGVVFIVRSMNLWVSSDKKDRKLEFVLMDDEIH